MYVCRCVCIYNYIWINKAHTLWLEVLRKYHSTLCLPLSPNIISNTSILKRIMYILYIIMIIIIRIKLLCMYIYICVFVCIYIYIYILPHWWFDLKFSLISCSPCDTNQPSWSQLFERTWWHKLVHKYDHPP